MTASDESSEWFRVENPEAARVLSDGREARYLLPFLGRETTVKGAAEEAGVSVLNMYRRVQRSVVLGLLRVSRTEARRGRAVRWYRSVADAFFIPYHVTPAETLEAMALQEDDRWRRQLISSLSHLDLEEAAPGQGLRIYRDLGGRVRVMGGEGPGRGGDEALAATVLDPRATATFSDWSTVTLNDEEAKEVQRQMFELWRSYLHKRDDVSGRRYIVRLALAPLSDQ